MRWRSAGLAGVMAAALFGVGDVTAAQVQPPTAPERPTPRTCEEVRPDRWSPATGDREPRGTLRVFAVQYKQAFRNVRTYASFRTAMRCLVEEFVVPNRRPGQPALVVFPEDVGLMTLATGARGTTVREQARSALRAPTGDRGPVSAAAALAQINAAYAPQVAAYQRMFGPFDPRKQALVGATDTFVRSFMLTFAEIARDYGVYVVASNNQARYRETHDPIEVATFADPAARKTNTAYVATSPRVANTTFLWAPHTTRRDAADGKRNLLFRNEKVPLTDLEKDLLALDPGPATGPEAIRNAAGVEIAGWRVGFATSLPAFTYGYPFGDRPVDLEPCADLSQTYMACMDELGVEVVVQADANPARWAGPGARSPWQPLEWMGSTWRAVADPTVDFRYNVTAHLTGNLFDIPFDGQSAITMRGGDAPPRHYIGNSRLLPGDPDRFAVYAGSKHEFVALAPWVVQDAPRDALRAQAARLAPGSGHPDENDYLQTAIYADLVPAKTRGRGERQ